MSISAAKAAIQAALRDYVVDGVPASGPNEPAKAEIRAALGDLADLVDTVNSIPADNLFLTEEEAIAAVEDGALFWVVATDDSSAIELRQRDGAGSILLKTLSSQEGQDRTLEALEIIRGRAALYDIAAAGGVHAFAATGSELLFQPGYYRVGLQTGSSPADLTGWTYSRAGASYALTADGTPSYFAADVPRITGRGLLIEAASQNQMPYSEALDQWAVDGDVTVTADYGLDPNGGMTADRVQMSAGANLLYRQGAGGSSAIGARTVSFWARALAGTATIGLRSGVNGATQTFVLTESWQRFSWVNSILTDNEELQFCNNAFAGAADAVWDALIWGVQIEPGAAMSSYIPTSGSAVDRAADLATLTLPAGSDDDRVIVTWDSGVQTLTRADLDAPNLLDLSAGHDWEGRYVESAVVVPSVTAGQVASNYVVVSQTNADAQNWLLTPVEGNTFIGDGLKSTYVFTVEQAAAPGLSIYVGVVGVTGSTGEDYRLLVHPDGTEPDKPPVGAQIELRFASPDGPNVGKWELIYPAKPAPDRGAADTLSFFARAAAARAVQQGFGY